MCVYGDALTHGCVLSPDSSITRTSMDKNSTTSMSKNSPPLPSTNSPTFLSTNNSPTTPGSPIILSDSSDSDVEIVPLAERIGLARLPGKDRPAKRSQDRLTPSTRTNDTTPPTRELLPHSNDEKTLSSTEGLSLSGGRLGGGRGESRRPEGLTPAQAAGMAALRRLEGSNLITQENSDTNIPIFDLTGDESDYEVIKETTRQKSTINRETSQLNKKSKSVTSRVKVKAVHSDTSQLCDLTNTDSHTISQCKKQINLEDNPKQTSCPKSGVPLGGSTNQGPPPPMRSASSTQTVPRHASSGNILSSVGGGHSLQSSQDNQPGSSQR